MNPYNAENFKENLLYLSLENKFRREIHLEINTISEEGLVDTITKLCTQEPQAHLFTNALKELYYWQYSRSGSFSNLVYDLIAKADNHNKLRLMQGFFPEVCMYWLWYSSDGTSIFKLMKELKIV